MPKLRNFNYDESYQKTEKIKGKKKFKDDNYQSSKQSFKKNDRNKKR